MPRKPVEDVIDKYQVMYLMIALTKARQVQKISREQVAKSIGVHIGQIHDFDERKTPWRSITVSFLQLYARAIGLVLEVGFQVPESVGEEEHGNTSDDR